ncbi:hypothetical protein MKX07_005962 [Trichoderma sp. CBMAI-0711]|nr:hypothetical protein MKX07_005962 [Trichoderma sp. CBMAI-0711]
MSNDHVQDFINRMASGNDPLGIIDSIIRDDIREREEEDRLIRAAILLAARELVAQHEDEEDDDELEEDEGDDGDEDETTASSESSSEFATLETPTPMPGHTRPRAPARRSLQIPGRASARVLSGMPPPTQERVLSTMPSTMVDSWVSSQRQLLSQSQARARTHAPSQSQPQSQAHSQAQSQPQATAQQSSQAMPPPQAPFQFGGLDRRAMERERLERLANRKGPSAAQKDDEAKAKDAGEDVVEIPPPKRQTTTSVSAGMGKTTSELEQQRQERVAKRQRPSTANKDDENSDDDVVEIPPPKRQATASTSAAKGTESKPTASVPAPASASSAAPQSSLPYPNGTVKRTWARGCARTGDDITIEEVFQKEHLELALLSSFQWDEEWMLSKLDISRTKLLLLAFAKDEAQKNQMRGNVPANIKFCFPPMQGVGAMHSKLQLLKYPNRLRVVIPTGNLVPYDWGETGVMENVDLPRLENPATTPQSPTAFYTELVYFLQATGVGDKMVASLSNYDFSKTSDIAFVHTIPGSHTGKAAERTGYCGLGASVAALGLASAEPCASLGALNHEFIEAIYNACRGRDGIEDFKNKSGAASSRSKAAKKPDEAAARELQERFRIYFPTERTVAGSRGGRNAGGTICVQAKWWRSPTFPTELVRDVIARDRLLVHSKMIFVRRVGHDQTAQQRPGWAYVGSANLSESAWLTVPAAGRDGRWVFVRGRLSRDRSTKAIKMNCRNWECGVILPVPESKAVDMARAGGDMAMFAGTVPVPMQVPGPAYASSDRPWFYTGA